jgi:hypothetical protein
MKDPNDAVARYVYMYVLLLVFSLLHYAPMRVECRLQE